jgi:hypothetical protein
VIFSEGFGYHRGRLRNPAGNVVFEFPVDTNAGINVALHNLFFDLDALVGKEVDTTNLPDSVTIDGTVYPITYEEDARQELIDAATVFADELGISNARAKRIMRAIYKVIKTARSWS